MKKIKLINVFSGLILSILAVAGPGFSMVLYDDFSGTTLDKMRWEHVEFVREIDAVSQKFVSKIATPNPIFISEYPYSNSNDLSFSNPNSINSIQTNVTIAESQIANQGHTRARVSGRWFNHLYLEGESGDGYKGDVWATVDIRTRLSGQLYAIWYVGKYTGSDLSTYEEIESDEFDLSITIGATYTVSIEYLSSSHQFKFKIGTEEHTFGSTDLPPNKGNAKSPGRWLTTRVQVDNANSSANIAAIFDNIFKNGVIYDDFSPPILSAAKWKNYEYVRESSGGKLRTKLRSSNNSTGNMYSRPEFIDPSPIRVIQTKVTPDSFQNSQGADIVARIAGGYYNDGSPGGGWIGDVSAQIKIGGTGTNPVAEWQVWRYKDPNGNNTENVMTGSFATSIVLGTTYTLYLEWDGSKFTFKIDDEEAQYTPTTFIRPPNNPWKEIGIRIFNASGKEASMEALFDDVTIEGTQYIYLQGLSAEKMGLAAWGDGHDIPSCISTTPLSSHYYGASRDWVDPSASYGLKGTGKTVGFQNFMKALADAGKTINDLTIKIDKVSLGNDTPGIDWEITGDRDTKYFYREDDNKKLTFYVAGVPILEQIAIKYTFIVDYNDPAIISDDFISGRTSYFIPLDITDGGTPKAIKDIATAFLNDINGKAIRIDFPILTLSGDFSFEGQSGKYLNVPNARLWLEEDGVNTLLSTKLSPSFYYKDLTTLETIFSDSFLGGGKIKTDLLNEINNELFSRYHDIRTNITKINYTLNGDTATVTWYWILTAKDISNNTFLMEKRGQQDVLKKENGQWVFYGNQEKYDIYVGSYHDEPNQSNYYAYFFINDPTHTITSATVTGTGIVGILTLANLGGAWGSFQDVNYGSSPPSNASYVITINDGSGTYIYNKTITDGVSGFATNLAPTGNVSGNLTFTFTGLPRSDVEYWVEFMDSSWNMVWDSSDVPLQTTGYCSAPDLLIPYGGPVLPAGTYHYNIISKIGANESRAYEEITYSGTPGILAVTPSEGLSASGFHGGPFTFSPSNNQYTLQNIGWTTIAWTATKNQNWIDLSKTSGTIAAGATDTVTVSINGNANTLVPGTYSDTLTFTNTTNHNGDTIRNIGLAVTGGLSVTPTEDLNSSGFEGGPFNPLSQSYTLTNRGATPISWGATKTKAWVKLSKTSGTLAAGATDAVTVSILSKSANAFDAGAFDDIVTLTNMTNGIGTTTRKVNLLGDAINISLSSPDNFVNFSICTYYPSFGPPTFQWDISGGTLKSLELQFYAENDPSKTAKVKATATELAQKSLQIKAATWKKILLLPGTEGGKINWKAVGTKQNKKKGESNTRSFFVSAPEAVGDPQISHTSKLQQPPPALSWENNCNSKFKVWFYNVPAYYDNPATAGVKKTSLSFTDTDPTDNSGVYSKELTSGQWTAIQNVVGTLSGFPIYWHVESSDVVRSKRITKTLRQVFLLKD